ncbi:MAG TPA: 2Fe-2S iron-sulfur cluster-binding protein [Solirubrobacteraceae bacterium]|nr:2Fe-2S iron-sulfur cluster-binding protein [Solirubrobacteraceae bacterium]
MPVHKFIVNGKRVSVDCPDDVRLLWVLRDLLGVHGLKYGCGRTVCYACTSLINGVAVQMCAVQVGDLHESDEVTTIEGLGDMVCMDLHPLQKAWLEYDVAQCGYCQPGQIMNALGVISAAHAQGRRVTDADLDQIRNVCRCGTYFRIREAIKAGEAAMIDEGLLPNHRSRGHEITL